MSQTVSHTFIGQGVEFTQRPPSTGLNSAQTMQSGSLVARYPAAPRESVGVDGVRAATTYAVSDAGG